MFELKNLPIDPGCYLYKDKSHEIIYIGKAKNLNKRVRSYFSKTIKDDKTTQLVSEIVDVEFFATSNEVEALILESNLIRKHKPKYNINLKESQRYAHIIITDEPYPRLRVARDKKTKGKYFGPYVNAEQRDTMIKILRANFQIRTCNKLPKKECLRFHIGLCSAPCTNKITKEEYVAQVEKVEQFLKGDTKKLVKNLDLEMKKYSAKLLFEKAKIVRDQLFALQKLDDRQKVELTKKHDEDVINYIIDNDKVYIMVFNVSRGVLATKDEYSFDLKPDFLEEFIVQYYSDKKPPKEIILPQKLSDESIQDYLTEKRESKVTINIPKIGQKLELLDLVKRNIEISFLNENQSMNELRTELKLNSTPYVIECFDISHLGGTGIVASMVQFKNAKPNKEQYRRFKIRTVQGNDDFASMNEVIKRRYKRLKEESLEMPDLIVVDGGKGQLSSAINSLKELDVKIPIIALAKKEEEIFFPGSRFPLRLKKDSKALKLLQQLRNEAHRFAVKYQRELRSKISLQE